MLIGFFLLLMGALLPFLMVIRLLQPNFPLSFLAHGLSLIGLILGFSGLARHVSSKH